MKAATVAVGDSVAKVPVDTMMAARRAMLAVDSVTWRKTAAKDKNATIVAAWDTSAAIATKPLKPRSAIGVNNRDTSPVTVPTSLLRPARRSARGREE